jgi:SAM-dependent methyltransferase
VRFIASSLHVKEFGKWVEEATARYGDNRAVALPPPTVIEIGTGGGWNLSVLPSNWRKIGYNVDKEYLAIAGEAFGFEMRFGLVDEALDAVGTADAVILSHVVEYFPDPKKALSSLVARMKPSALLLIEVPGLFRIHRSVFNPMTFWQNAHTFTFCAGTLVDACESASLEVLEKDEICRAVFRKSRKPVLESMNASNKISFLTMRFGLPSRILHYLRLCEIGFSTMLMVRKIPLVGRLLAGVWRKIYFPLLKFFVPSLGRNQ